MEAITNRFIIPPKPMPTEIKTIYPWEETELLVVCQQLYDLAIKSGYEGTFSEFKENFGAFLQINNYELYYGQYDVTPLSLVDQILKTKNKILTDDIVIASIPYATTTNSAGGYTVTIG